MTKHMYLSSQIDHNNPKNMINVLRLLNTLSIMVSNIIDVIIKSRNTLILCNFSGNER